MTRVYKQAIITRTKNRPILFERAVKSVTAQTSSDYVHVILNDGGDKAEVERILKDNPGKNRVIIHNKESVGLTKALNQAIRAVHSTYVAILDDDDTWAPERVKETNDYLDKHDDQDAVVVSMDKIIEKIDEDNIVEIQRDRWYPGLQVVSLYDQMLDNYLSNGCTSYRRSLFEELGGYDESLEVAEDWDFGIRTLIRGDVFVMQKVLAYYHHRPEQTGRDGNSVFAEYDTHKKNLVKLRNKYLREDVKKGSLRVGYIMNSMAHSKEQAEKLAKDLDSQTTRIEGHVNAATQPIVDEIKNSKCIVRNFVKRVLRRLRNA